MRRKSNKYGPSFSSDTIVQYIGGQDKAGELLYKLKIGEIYTIKKTYLRYLNTGRETIKIRMVTLFHIDKVRFISRMFKKVK